MPYTFIDALEDYTVIDLTYDAALETKRKCHRLYKAGELSKERASIAKGRLLRLASLQRKVHTFVNNVGRVKYKDDDGRPYRDQLKDILEEYNKRDRQQCIIDNCVPIVKVITELFTDKSPKWVSDHFNIEIDQAIDICSMFI